jgi:electron transfer flavoprotein beta subunit
MKAKKVAIQEVTPTRSPAGPGRRRLKLPPVQPSQVEILGEGPEAAGAVVDLFEKLGVLR